ncbi:MAG: hypothetical protein ACJ77K_14800 [Bacteroidia bacterium]
MRKFEKDTGEREEREKGKCEKRMGKGGKREKGKVLKRENVKREGSDCIIFTTELAEFLGRRQEKKDTGEFFYHRVRRDLRRGLAEMINNK